MPNKKVIILGGGVAGMSAAHELIERGFEVQVFETKLALPGGKARSVNVPDPDMPAGPYKPLPGEHGFRFFPGFYKHVIDTMKRIPFEGNKNGVFDNLVAAPHVMLARKDTPPLIMLDRFPKSFADFKFLLQSLHQKVGIPPAETRFFEMRMWQLMTSCRERRENDYEREGWWQYTDAEKKSQAYQDLLAKGLTRTLVASRAKTASTKTGGDVLLQLVFNMANPSIPTDRILSGPTNDQWLTPWLTYLKRKGVDYQFLSRATGIECEGGKITGVWIEKLVQSADAFPEPLNAVQPRHDYDEPRLVPTANAVKYQADYYICAVPVEIAAPLLISDILNGQSIHEFLTPVIHSADLTDPSVSIIDITNDAIGKAAVMQADPTLIGIVELANDVAWMTGVQFFLNVDITLNEGHIIFADSKWAVTAISQSQFWATVKMNTYADGKVKTVLSCDVSEWDKPGEFYTTKTAKQSTPEEIRHEVWEQMKHSLIINGESLLKDEMIHTWFLDRDIEDTYGNNENTKGQLSKGDYFSSRNQEPLLVNKVDTWRLRPESHCSIPNLFFASDYVRTHTDLATMEGANEAARRAVNNIIDASGSDARPCEIWDLHEPWIFSFLRKHDLKRYAQGRQWNEQFPWWVRVIQWIISQFKKGAKKSTATKNAMQPS